MRRRHRLRIVVSLRSAPSRLGRFLTGSFAVHGTLLAAILIVPATRHRVTPIEDTMTVALSGPLAEAAAPRGTSQVAPPKQVKPPEPAPQPKEARTVREVPISKPKDKPKKPSKEPVKPPEPETPKAPTDTEPTSPPGEKPGPATGAAGSAVTATVGGGDSALGWYAAAVKAALESAWVKPYLEDAQGTVSVVVAFDIARDGTSRNFRVVQPSGIPSLDRSAQRAAIEASPFPAVPPTWTEETVPVTMRFDLTPEPR